MNYAKSPRRAPLTTLPVALVLLVAWTFLVVGCPSADPDDQERVVECPEQQVMVTDDEGNAVCRDVCDEDEDCQETEQCGEVDGHEVCLATPGDDTISPPDRNETARVDQPDPLDEVVAAVENFQQEDPDASFSYFEGYVDNFATTPKDEIPEYALSILDAHDLSTDPETPRLLPRPLHAADDGPKPSFDADGQPDVALPFVNEEPLDVDDPVGPVDGDDEAESSEETPESFPRSQPAENPQEFVDWQRPSDQLVAQQREVVEPILAEFLARNQDLFGVGEGYVDQSLMLLDFSSGPYGRMANFGQFYGENEPLLYGKTIVSFDVNWNVIGISRMLTTPDKLEIPELSNEALHAERAWTQARHALEEYTGHHSENWTTMEPPVLSVDPIRQQRVWDLQMTDWQSEHHYRVLIDPETGEALNISDLVSQSPGASVNRWFFSGGDLMNPTQVVAGDVYTRGSNTLEHDFFYVMSDHRCEGDPKQHCSDTTPDSTFCGAAYGTESGSSQIRATRRSSLDFHNYFPTGASQTFYETHAYYWSRLYSQWLKTALDALGKLPSSAADFPRVLIITNPCQSGSNHRRNYNVTTVGGKAQDINVIRLANRSGTSNHNAACESGACFDNPGNIAHELNHFYLWRYFDVSSDLDCDAGVQLQFTHEGTLGTVVPHAFWHAAYGIGYEPDSTDQLYFSHRDIGRVHTTGTNKMVLSDYLCSDYDDDPYSAGRVVGQPLWEIYHGNKVEGSSSSATWYPSTDRDFNVIVHWASELQAGSTFKDRYELANRVMEIMDKHSELPDDGKSDWCEIFEHHELHWYIDDDYCG